MGASQRRKGAAGERELAHVLTEHTGLEWRRGIQQTRFGGSEGGDVVCQDWPELHVECKRGKRCNIVAAMRQAEADTADNGRIPIAATRSDGEGWLVTMRLADWARLAVQALAAEEVPCS